MEINKNTKNIQANVQFLKKFEGKKTLITKTGLIDALNSDLASSLFQSRISRNRQEISSRNSLENQLMKPVSQSLNTQPSPNFESPTKNLNWMTPQFSFKQPSRKENSSGHSIRTEKLNKQTKKNSVFESNLGYSADLANLKSSLNRLTSKLPKLTKSNSMNKEQRYGKIIEYAVLYKKSNKYSELKNDVKLDSNAAQYMEQLQKFQANLRSLKSKSTKILRMSPA